MDNFVANPASGGLTFASDDIGGVQYPISKLAYGALDNVTLVSTSNGLPTILMAGRNFVGYSSEPPTDKVDRSIATSTSNQQAAAANANRLRLVFQNQDAAINVFINIGAAATLGQGSIRIAPGAMFELTGTTGTVNIIAASGTPIVTIWEF